MTINPRSRHLPANLLDTFRSLPPATIGHIVEDGFVDPAIRPIFKRVSIVGSAVTLKLPEDLSLTRPAIEQLQPGDVLIVDHGGDTWRACWGEMTSLAAQVRGCAGVIIDGAVTDVVEIEEQRMPTYARGVSALVGRRLDTGGGGINVSVQCGGVAVHPGDLVVGDDNGIVVIPPQRAAQIAAEARAAEDRAPFARVWVQRGGSLADLHAKSAADIQQMLRERGWS